MEEEAKVEKKAKPVKLRMKKFPVGVSCPTAIWPEERHLPEVAKKERRGKVFVGEIFEVESKEVAQEYLDKFWFLEIVP